MRMYDAQYKKTNTEQKISHKEFIRDYILIATIYGIPFILGWGISVMAGVKWNSYLLLMAAPIYLSMFIAGSLAFIRRLGK